MTKPTYVKAVKKKTAREFVFSHFNVDSIIGLAGPDINEYAEWCNEKGFKNIEVWENNTGVMLSQLSKLSTNIPIVYKFGDIIQSESKPNSLYDLDYCGTASSVYDHLAKFKNEKFIMTFSVRKIGVDNTVNLFFKTRKEKIISNVSYLEPIEHNIIKTVFGQYLVVKYFDTMAMITISKFK